MSDNSRSLRIDWFDGTIIEEARPSNSFTPEESETNNIMESILKVPEQKTIGFKKLLSISLLQMPVLSIELANRPGFWLLLETKLNGDFLVLMVKIFATVYKCVNPNDDTKIVTLLRTKFEASNFIERLTDYVKGLPKVRISQKRMNSFLWKDVESFFYNVLELYTGIFNFCSYQIDYLINLHELVNDTLDSAIGVQEEHSEIIGDNFYSQCNELKSKMYKAINQIPENEECITITENKDPDYYKNLSIFPAKDDLIGKNNVKIIPNIINGAYPSVDHYLDLQFKLFREDCFGPLREGIKKYSENPSKRRYENIRIYPKVRVICNHTSGNRIGHLVDLRWNERNINTSVDCTKYADNKWLMFGSLLLFTNNNFQTIICASVLDSDLDLLQKGYVGVLFESPVSEEIYSEQYLMLESEVYFEPYHRVLKVLQECKTNDLPMKKYIIDVQTDAIAPSYLTTETLFKVEDEKFGTVYVPMLEPKSWPPASFFGLDESQMDAFQFALTREFAVLQGPPGTGKTFIGTKIASLILGNMSLQGTPMLIICYTNFALDQFLESILTVTDSVIRLGNQSKSEILEPYNLNNIKSTVKSSYSYLYGNKKAELEGFSKEMSRVKGDLNKCDKEILSYSTIKQHLTINGTPFELKCTKEDAILDWLFGHLDVEEELRSDQSEDLQRQFEGTSLTDTISTCFSQQWALKEIDGMKKNMEYIKQLCNKNVESEMVIKRFEKQITKITKRLNLFRKQMTLGVNSKQYDIKQPCDVYTLTSNQRWYLYFKAVDAVKKKIGADMNELVERHRSCSASLDEVATMMDVEIMKGARVVGVTTTVAARRHDLMRKLMSPIVIIEEAAEVLEAHIVASLTHRCQHLILIGDHKQLKPSAAHYILAKNYNLEISLFERMIRNGVHARTLTTQRRMRPDFVQLLVPAIYPRLDCHPSVGEYPRVNGMVHNLYFFTHQTLEDTEGLDDSWSHRNKYEARWCVSLANYLRKMNYGSHEITILATYTGQANLIKQLSASYDLLNNVTITVVDNYQGKENRIVILSLVRSNKYGQIGFLSADNRICVALSRAKEGFYIFGNMSNLKSSSSTWRVVNEKLEKQQALGGTLSLSCPRHGTRADVTNTKDLENCLREMCLKNCEI